LAKYGRLSVAAQGLAFIRGLVLRQTVLALLVQAHFAFNRCFFNVKTDELFLDHSGKPQINSPVVRT